MHISFAVCTHPHVRTCSAAVGTKVKTIFQAINALEVENNRSLKQTLTVMNDEFLKGKIQDQLKNRAIETFGTLKECLDFRMLNSLIKLSLKV